MKIRFPRIPRQILTSLVAALMCCAVMRAEKTFDGYREILSIAITDIKCDAEIDCGNGRRTLMLSFGGSCDNEYFKGIVLPGAFDNQKFEEGGAATLSARYVLKGVDCEGKDCQIFIENNATVGSSDSKPTVFTDSRALSFLNSPGLIGYLDSDGPFTIRIYAPSDLFNSDF